MSVPDAFFVDSNLLLYYVDPVDRRKQTLAAEWLDRLWSEGTGRLSWQVLHEFYWNAVRKMRLDPAAARRLVEQLTHWQPVDTSAGLVRQAWHWMDASPLSYGDALIVSAAQRSGAAYLLSEDFQAGRRYDAMEVVNPFERPAAEFPSKAR